MIDDPNFFFIWETTSIFLIGTQPQFCSRQPRELIFGMQPYLTKLNEIWKTTYPHHKNHNQNSSPKQGNTGGSIFLLPPSFCHPNPAIKRNILIRKKTCLNYFGQQNLSSASGKFVGFLNQFILVYEVVFIAKVCYYNIYR